MKLYAKEVKKVFARQGRGGEFCALSPVDLTLTPGKLVEITGRSGSGKSTLLQILGALMHPTAGQVFLDDADLYALGDGVLSKLRNRHIGVIPQGHTALRSFSVAENVILPARLYPPRVGEDPADEEALQARAAALLEKVGIGDLAKEEPTALSGGELRRVAIARALMQRPEILLADEPTGDLDDENTARVLKLLRQCADDGAAVLLVTHEGAAAAYADEIYEMSAGVLRRVDGGEKSLG